MVGSLNAIEGGSRSGEWFCVVIIMPDVAYTQRNASLRAFWHESLMVGFAPNESGSGLGVLFFCRANRVPYSQYTHKIK